MFSFDPISGSPISALLALSAASGGGEAPSVPQITVGTTIQEQIGWVSWSRPIRQVAAVQATPQPRSYVTNAPEVEQGSASITRAQRPVTVQTPQARRHTPTAIEEPVSYVTISHPLIGVQTFTAPPIRRMVTAQAIEPETGYSLTVHPLIVTPDTSSEPPSSLIYTVGATIREEIGFAWHTKPARSESTPPVSEDFPSLSWTSAGIEEEPRALAWHAKVRQPAITPTYALPKWISASVREEERGYSVTFKASSAPSTVFTAPPVRQSLFAASWHLEPQIEFSAEFRQSYAPSTEPAPVEPLSGGGGWEPFQLRYLAEHIRKLEREKRFRERMQDVRKIPDRIDREIARLLSEQDEQREHEQELQRLLRLAREHDAEKAAAAYNAEVGRAYERAIRQGNYSAIEALQRILGEMIEQEQFMLMAMLLLEDQD